MADFPGSGLFENSTNIPIEKKDIYLIYKINLNPNNNKVYFYCVQIMIL